MRKDERLNANVKIANSIGYMVFWYGIFAVLLYRWYVLDQSLSETLDFFIIWFLASIVQFMVLALKGTPITYPVAVNKKEQLYFMFITPLVTGALTVVILIVFRDVLELTTLMRGFLAAFMGTLALFTIYRVITYFWEKKNT